MSSLAQEINVHYNGVTFPVETRTRLVGRPIPDKANRVTKYVEYTLHVDTWITAGLDDIDDTMEDIRRKLNQKGGQLLYTGFGLGTDALEINVPGGTVQDVSYGPHPEILELQTYGPTLAWKLVWQCKFTIPDQCSSPFYDANHLAGFAYTWGVSIDDRGYSTRTISGELEIPITEPGLVIDKDADAKWDELIAAIPIPPGFRRSSTRSLSEDRRTLTFTITDAEQTFGAFVPGCVRFEGTHSVASSQKLLRRWTSTLQARYEMQRGTPKSDAAKHFRAMIDGRRKHAKANGAVAMLPVAFSVNDSLHDESIAFSFSYAFTAPADVAVNASGMWLPVPQQNWDEWYKSTGEVASHARGNARIYYGGAHDAVISLCSSKKPKASTFKTRLGKIGVGGWQGGFDADSDFVHFVCRIEYVADTNVVIHRPLGTPPEPASWGDGDGFVSPFTQGTVPPAIVQRPKAATVYVDLVGEAIRAGSEVTPPELLQIGGMKATLVKQRFATAQRASLATTLYAAKWRFRYVLTDLKREKVSPPPVLERARTGLGDYLADLVP